MSSCKNIDPLFNTTFEIACFFQDIDPIFKMYKRDLQDLPARIFSNVPISKIRECPDIVLKNGFVCVLYFLNLFGVPEFEDN